MDGMQQGAREGGAAMSWMDGMQQGAREGGAAMSWMDGMQQGAREGGAAHAQGCTTSAVKVTIFKFCSLFH